MAGKSGIDAFRAAHDPLFGIHAPTHIYRRDLPATFSRAIFVAAQNATPVHADNWACLLNAAQRLKAELFVEPIRYKNPTSHWSGSQQGAEYYDPAVVPYLWNVRHRLNSNLVFLADIPRQLTESNPLRQLDGVTHADSAIVGHSKMQFRTVATPGNRMAKILTTTGVCTVENYTPSGAGKVGEFHHSLSAILVELDGPIFHLRQLHYSKTHNAITDGARGMMYLANGKTRKAPRPLVLSMGDTHVDVIDPSVDAATFAPGGIITELQPQSVVWADLLDANSITHHEERDQLLRMAKERGGRRNIEKEVDRAIEFVRVRTYEGVENVIQAANHNDMLRRWVVDGIQNGFRDPLNAPFGLRVGAYLAAAAKMTPSGAEYPDPFKWLFESAKIPQARVLGRRESFAPGGIESGMHGDEGPNGTRGSRKNLARIGVKSNINHSHSPGIEEGCYQAGTSTRLDLRYLRGPSSWLNTHVLQQHDNKRQLITMIDGKWRL